MRAFKVYAIKNGTVIDHIPQGVGLDIIELLQLRKSNKVVTLGSGFHSKKLKKKDIVKIEDKEFSPEETNKIAIIAPTASLNIIRDFKIIKKFKVKLPDEIVGIVKCPNPNCITNHDNVKTRFYREATKELVGRCAYCERYFNLDKIELL
ncbi:aspartate carbamoyltransferase regulatory subunit [Patescibacteria group bacterium]|nr:aspartate carbamoyltransferase regulatory subunit [Patescibacteria group bacterium]